MEIKTKNASYTFLPELGVLINSEIAGEFSHLIPTQPNADFFISRLRRELPDEEIEKQLSSIQNVTFNITEDCNFRCRYCSYSGNYNTLRTHSRKKLSLDCARKMINLLIKWMKRKIRTVKPRIVNIGFYGGEALLELELVERIIYYTKEKFSGKGDSQECR